MISRIKTVLGLGCVGCVAMVGMASAGPELVAFPEGYKDEKRKPYATVNRDDERMQVVVMYANDIALASAMDGAPLDSGSVLTMEVYKAKLNDEGKAIDDEGNPIKEGALFAKDELAVVVVMESRDGFGEDYPDELRNGTWEYALFNGDGSRIDKETTACFECHKPLHDTDYVFSFEQLQAAPAN